MVALAVVVLLGLAWWVLQVPYEVAFGGETVDCEVTEVTDGSSQLVNVDLGEACDDARSDRRTTALLIGAAVATAAAAASTIPSRGSPARPSAPSRPARPRRPTAPDPADPGWGGRRPGGTVAAVRTARVIPCLDVTAGRVVKGVNFVDLRDAGDPVELAARYDAEGADELVFLDITASSDDRDTMVEVVAHTAEQVFIPLTVGGGIRTVDDARRMLRAGADKVSLNTAAINRPDTITDVATEFGTQCAVVAIDARRRRRRPVAGLGRVHPRRPQPHRARRHRVGGGGRAPGAGEILLTSMDRDGTRDGFDLELTRAISDAVGIPVIASGGVSAPCSTWPTASPSAGADAVLAASIFHFGEHTVAEAKAVMAAAGITVRPAGPVPSSA